MLPKWLVPIVRTICALLFALLSTLSVIAFSCGYHAHNGWIMAGSIIWMALMTFVDVLFIRSVTLSQEGDNEDETKDR